MRTSRVKTKLQRDEPALITTLHFTDPSVYELTSLMGFDGIWMDLEHHVTSLETASRLMRAARVGTADIIARPAKGEFMRMSRMLEAGAQGIMYPRCDDAAEAAEVVRWAKFAPEGTRGVDSANPDNPYLSLPLPEYLRRANEQTFIVIQLESQEAIDQVDEIAAVPGVDVLMLGPGDFSILSGFPGEWEHERIRDAQRAIGRAAKAAGKHWGCPAFTRDDAKRLLDDGARFICHGGDIVLLKNALQRIQSDFAELGFTFDDRFKPPK
ncbi:MAG: HpcH/HpaI aldolase/citrate lyase family protein [Pirellulaceae bacterium]